MNKIENQVAVYGGSFNPPTRGHEFVIENILTKTKIKKIILNPDGPRVDKNYKIEHYHREKMIDMFLLDLINKGFNVGIDKYFFNGKNGKDTTIMQVKDYYKSKLGF